MGNFEKLSVLVIVVIIVMILVVALYTWTGDPSGTEVAANVATAEKVDGLKGNVVIPPPSDRSAMAEVKPPVKPIKSAQDILDEIERERRSRESAMDTSRSGDSEGMSGGADPVAGMDGAGSAIAETPVVKPPRIHVVSAGETIGLIAKREYPGAGQRAIDGILKANPQVDPTRMAINTKLVMPDLGGDSKGAEGPRPGASPGTPAGVAASIKPGSVYVTRKGDTLPNLANRAYRDKNQWHRIWVENFDEISDTEHLPAGLRLRIPVL